MRVNGQAAGPKHQGGFYRFHYDITALVKPGPQSARSVGHQGVVERERESRRAPRRLLDVRRHLSSRVARSASARSHRVDRHRRAGRRQLLRTGASGSARHRRKARVRARVYDQTAMPSARPSPRSDPRQDRDHHRQDRQPRAVDRRNAAICIASSSLRTGRHSTSARERFGFRSVEVRPGMASM